MASYRIHPSKGINPPAHHRNRAAYVYIMFLFSPCQKKREKPRPSPILGSEPQKSVIKIPYLFDRLSETSIFDFTRKKVPKSMGQGLVLFLIVPQELPRLNTSGTR
jgi:hypothetical protein